MITISASGGSQINKQKTGSQIDNSRYMDIFISWKQPDPTEAPAQQTIMSTNQLYKHDFILATGYKNVDDCLIIIKHVDKYMTALHVQ